MKIKNLGMLLLILVSVIIAGFVIAEIKNGLNARMTEAQPIGGNILYVGGVGAGNYSSIQSAINAANDGDTIFVYNGTYYENVVINKRINLIGEDKETTIIDGSGNGNSVEIDVNHVNISNLHVKHSGYSHAGIEIEGNNNIICNCNISRNRYGIYISYSDDNTISDCNIYSNSWYGIYISYSDDNTISDCNISDNNKGILVSYANDNMIYLNNFVDNGDHIYSYESDNIWHTPLVKYLYDGNNYTNYLGNHWDNYTGDDIAGDGVGDIPQKVDKNNYDNYPLIKSSDNYRVFPIATFTYSRLSSLGNIQFTDFSYDLDGYIINWTWNFGDGNTSYEQNPIHQYADNGRYNVTLTIKDNDNLKDFVENEIIASPIRDIGIKYIDYPPEILRITTLNHVNVTLKNYGIEDIEGYVGLQIFDLNLSSQPHSTGLIYQSGASFGILNSFQEKCITIPIYGGGLELSNNVFYAINLTTSVKDENLSNNYENKTFFVLSDMLYVDDDYNESVFGWGIIKFNHIQDAIDNASDGDTIFVYNGTYYENVVVDKTINLIGEDKNNTIIDGGWNGNIINIKAGWVNISGFTIKRSGSSNAGIIFNSTFVNISKNIILNNNCGIYAGGLAYTIFGNLITDNLDGISTSGLASGNILTNTIIENGHGIYVNDTNDIFLSRNTISSNGDGIYLFNSDNNKIFDNIISDNNALGIKLDLSCDDNVISGNIISDGIWIWLSCSNIISNNTIFGKGMFLESSSGNKIFNNYFDVLNVEDNGNNQWNTTKVARTNIIGGNYLGGNYWSDYNGNDTDGDGLGDTMLPYNCSGNIMHGGDWLPLVPSIPPAPSIVYVDNGYNASVQGWQYDHFNKIQDGIDAVAENGTVYVFNGTYYENVVVNKSISLIGEDRNNTIIDGNYSGDVVNITANRVNISGFTITHSGSWPNSGIKISSNNNTVYYCDIYSNNNGIYIDSSYGNNLRYSEVLNNNGYGIYIQYSEDNRISHCNIYSNNYDGVSLYFSNNTTLCRCNIYLNIDWGIWLRHSNNNKILKCKILQNDEGVRFSSSNSNIISNCDIYSNNIYGIGQEYSTNNVICYNNIYNNPLYGIYNWYQEEKGVIDAIFNYWVSPSGPYNPTLNPNGTGDNISGNVIFKPWLTAPVKGGKEESIREGENEINAVNETDTTIKINTTVNNTARIISYESPPVEEPKTIKAVGKYVEISVKNETAIQWPIFIKIYYTQEDLNKAGITEDKLLGIYFYNESVGEWQLYNDTGVNTTNVIVNGKQYAGYAYAYAWHLTNITIGGDVIPPEISNVEAIPLKQKINRHVNITCNVTDNVNVSSVFVNITYPNGSYHNISMIKTEENTYYYNATYSLKGNYTYFVWANDTSGNANASSHKTFSIFIPQYTLTTSVDPSNAGSVTPSGGTYDAGSIVTITAHANDSYKFDHWGGDVSGSNSTIQITMDSNKSIIAYFVKIQYTLTTSVIPSNAGSISLNPSGGIYDGGTVVTATANANSGYEFDHWSGDVSSSNNPIQITMDGNKSIIAYFVPIQPSPPPNAPPTCSITSPLNGSTVNGTITIKGTASDDKEVVKVEIRIDSKQWIQALGTTSWSYSLDTTTLENGKHVIEARSYDGSLHSNIASISLNVFNNHKPNLEIIKPENNATVNGTITIKGKAWDEDGNETITKVEIRIDNGSWYIANGTMLWNYTINTKELKNGIHEIKARAYDGSLYSKIVSIHIQVANKKKTPGFEFIALVAAVAIVLAIIGIKKRNG